MAKWCTVTVTDAKGERHSMDLRAESVYDAAHRYVTDAKIQEAGMFPSRVPRPTISSVFEVIVDGKIYRVQGAALQRRILQQRAELNGPKGHLFRQRPGLE